VIIWELIALANIVRDTYRTRVVSHHYFHITTNSSYLPELGSNRLCQVFSALTELTGTKIIPFDLMEFIEN